MFSWEIEQIKVGKKVKQISDGTIWTVTKKLTDTHWSLERDNGNGTILVSMLSTNNCKFSLVVNSYTFDMVVKITVDANSEEEARKVLPKEFENDEEYYNIDSITLVDKKEYE